MGKYRNRIISSLGIPKLLNYQSIDDRLDDDYYLCGFPKSGNTWMQHLITGILYEMTMAEASNRLVRELTPDIHLTPWYKRFRDSMCFKSHLQPMPKYKQVIYIVRDGKDSLTSYFHMLQGQGVEVKLADMVKEGEHLFPTQWHVHVRQWIDNPYRARILYLKYEDLKSDPITELKKVCQFMNLERDDALLHQIIHNCSFDHMRKKEESGLWDKKSSWGKGNYFLRKGEIGDYKNHMAPELIEAFNKKSESELKHFGFI